MNNGGVFISPNIKKEKEQIDINGNIVKPFTKEVIKKNEADFIPSSPDLSSKPKKQEAKAPEGKPNPLAEAIKKQVQEQVQKTLAEIDIAGMVKQAVEEAFK